MSSLVVFVFLAVGGLWMLWDAIQRRAEAFWLAILILLFPFSWPAYFLVVKSRDYAWSRWFGGHGTRRPSSLRDLEARAVADDTLEAKLDLADALELDERAREAERIYRDILRANTDDLRALHGLARALMSLGRFEEAVEALEKVLHKDRAYRAYAAALDYADALWLNDQRTDTLELLGAMVATTGRMNHRVAYAHYLTQAGQKEQARVVLAEALQTYEKYRPLDKQREQYWAIRAEQMLDEIAA